MPGATAGSTGPRWTRFVCRELVSRFIVLAWTVLAPCSALAQTPLSSIHDAFAAEEKETHKRAELIHVRGGLETRYIIRRVLPDRLHMIETRPDREQSELIVIKDRMFRRVRGVWQQGPAPGKVEGMPSMTDLLSQLTNVKEHERQRAGSSDVRVFTADISWLTPQGRNVGSLEISIDARTNLPTALAFNGTCGVVACSFRQSLEYDRRISIEPPVK